MHRQAWHAGGVLTCAGMCRYERRYIERWLAGGSSTCPATGTVLAAPVTLTPNVALRKSIEVWAEKHATWLLVCFLSRSSHVHSTGYRQCIVCKRVSKHATDSPSPLLNAPCAADKTCSLKVSPLTSSVPQCTPCHEKTAIEAVIPQTRPQGTHSLRNLSILVH